MSRPPRPQDPKDDLSGVKSILKSAVGGIDRIHRRIASTDDNQNTKSTKPTKLDKRGARQGGPGVSFSFMKGKEISFVDTGDILSDQSNDSDTKGPPSPTASWEKQGPPKHRTTESMDTNSETSSVLTGFTGLNSDNTALPGPGRVRAPASEMNSLDFERVVNTYSIRATRSRLFTKKEVRERATRLDLAWSIAPSEATDLTTLLEEGPSEAGLYDTFDSSKSEDGRGAPLKKRSKTLHGHSGRTLTRWLFICLTGFFTGIIAIFIVWCTDLLSEVRLDKLDEQQQESVEAAHAEAEATTNTAEEFEQVYRSSIMRGYFLIFLRYASYNLTLALSSSALCLWLAPGAVGSGIPEMMAYLNGIRVTKFHDFKLFIVKIIGTILSVSSGLAIGPEGPLVHLGAVVGASLTKTAHLLEKVIFFFRRNCPSVSNLIGCATAKSHYKDEIEVESERANTTAWSNSALSNLAYYMKHFSNDEERRDLITAGAACGFAAAFGAPIGGLLFSLEEASSFFAQQLLLKTLISTAIATLLIALYNGSLAQFGVISLDTGNTGMISDETSAVLLIPLYILVGIQGGLLGALFNGTWEKMMETRSWFINRESRSSLEQKMWKLLTLSFLSILTSTLCYVLPLILHWSCKDLTGDENESRRRFNCANGQHNELASILFGSRDDAIKRMISDPSDFDPRTLLTVFLVFYPLYLMTFGESVPSGIFMPTVLTGAALGGYTGMFFQNYIASDIEPATFAVLGAAALLSGVQRNVVSLCVILVEGTGEVRILIPVIVTSVTARYVGDLFNEGVYHMGMHLKHYPFLEHKTKTVFDIIRCSDVMSCPVRVVESSEKAGDLEKMLLRSNHHAYPVVDPETKKFLGLVRRDQLIALLEVGIFTDDDSERTADSGRTFQRIRKEDYQKKTPSEDRESFERTRSEPSVISPSASECGRVEKMERAKKHHSTLADFRRDNVLGSLVDSHDGEKVRLNDKLMVSHDNEVVTLDGDDALPVVRVRRKNNPFVTTAHDGKLIIHLPPEDRQKLVDVAAVMNRGAYCVTDSCPMSKAYTLFTALGLRHLVVLGGANGGNVVGIITRWNLNIKFIEERTGIEARRTFGGATMLRNLSPRKFQHG